MPVENNKKHKNIVSGKNYLKIQSFWLYIKTQKAVWNKRYQTGCCDLHHTNPSSLFPLKKDKHLHKTRFMTSCFSNRHRVQTPRRELFIQHTLIIALLKTKQIKQTLRSMVAKTHYCKQQTEMKTAKNVYYSIRTRTDSIFVYIS